MMETGDFGKFAAKPLFLIALTLFGEPTAGLELCLNTLREGVVV